MCLRFRAMKVALTNMQRVAVSQVGNFVVVVVFIYYLYIFIYFFVFACFLYDPRIDNRIPTHRVTSGGR